MKPSFHQPLLFFFFLATFLPLILTVHSKPSSSDFIRESCNDAAYPDLCFSSLSSFSKSVHNDPVRLIQAAISVSISKTRKLVKYLSKFTTRHNNGSHPTEDHDFDCCLKFVQDSIDSMRDSMKQMKELDPAGSVLSFTSQIDNVQTWLTAASTYLGTCTGECEGKDEPARVEDIERRKKEVATRVDDNKKFTSNALALVNNYADNVIH